MIFLVLSSTTSKRHVLMGFILISSLKKWLLLPVLVVTDLPHGSLICFATIRICIINHFSVCQIYYMICACGWLLLCYPKIFWVIWFWNVEKSARGLVFLIKIVQSGTLGSQEVLINLVHIMIIHFWFGFLFGSPAGWLAGVRLQASCTETGAAIGVSHRNDR